MITSVQALVADPDVENVHITDVNEAWVTYASDTARGREAGGQPVGPFTITPFTIDLTDDDGRP